MSELLLYSKLTKLTLSETFPNYFYGILYINCILIPVPEYLAEEVIES